MTRVLPTAPGWWWVSLDGGAPQAVLVERDTHGRLHTTSGSWLVNHKAWTWLEPIPAPGALRGEVYAGEVFPDGVGMSVALPLGTVVTIGARVRVYLEDVP